MSKSCQYDPRETAGLPIGMYHCPECGEMVLAGVEHPDYSILDESNEQQGQSQKEASEEEK